MVTSYLNHDNEGRVTPNSHQLQRSQNGKVLQQNFFSMAASLGPTFVSKSFKNGLLVGKKILTHIQNKFPRKKAYKFGPQFFFSTADNVHTLSVTGSVVFG